MSRCIPAGSATALRVVVATYSGQASGGGAVELIGPDDDGVATIALNYGKANAFDLTLVEALTAVAHSFHDGGSAAKVTQRMGAVSRSLSNI